MAADNSLMAWTRTALSLISFGFTMYKVLENIETNTRLLHREHTPRNVGLFLIAVGTLSIWMGAFEYYSTLKELSHLREVRFWRGSTALALIMCLTGLVLFFGVVERVF